VIDRNVGERCSGQLRAYFAHHDIELHTLIYRAMEVDKGIRTVERMHGDFKRLGVMRTEPVLIAGGGVLTETAGLACALHHRNTPYVMLSTSLVAGIDAGPSARTCCDGFGYKNLIGADHAPILSITDRTFYATMHEGVVAARPAQSWRIAWHPPRRTSTPRRRCTASSGSCRTSA